MAFFRSSRKANHPRHRFPELHTGMRAEVLTSTNALIFTGRLRVLDFDLLEVRFEDDSFTPLATYGLPVKLRVTQRGGAASTLCGSVTQTSPEFWRIEDLHRLHEDESRDFYRQNTGAAGFIYTASGSYKSPRTPCRVLDISASGARLVTERLLYKDAPFYLETSLLPGEPAFTLTCRVTRVYPAEKAAGKYEYGCHFSVLTQKEQDRLVRSVFTLQRKALHARKL